MTSTDQAGALPSLGMPAQTQIQEKMSIQKCGGGGVLNFHISKFYHQSKCWAFVSLVVSTTVSHDVIVDFSKAQELVHPKYPTKSFDWPTLATKCFRKVLAFYLFLIWLLLGIVFLVCTFQAFISSILGSLNLKLTILQQVSYKYSMVQTWSSKNKVFLSLDISKISKKYSHWYSKSISLAWYGFASGFNSKCVGSMSSVPSPSWSKIGQLCSCLNKRCFLSLVGWFKTLPKKTFKIFAVVLLI